MRFVHEIRGIRNVEKFSLTLLDKTLDNWRTNLFHFPKALV
jgi:hypothetical protein